ncbi:hypothetical protein ACV07N_07055 [Roseivirga echinicomitans]
MKKRIVICIILAICFCLGVIPEATSEVMSQPIPCYKHKDGRNELVSFMYCPPIPIFSSACDYKDGWNPEVGSESSCNFNVE